MATNINYPAVNLPCPLLSGNTYQPGTTFIRSEFDYAIRQRKQYCAQYSVGFSFVIKSQIQMETFKDFFYNTLNYGVNSFLADWEIEGMDGIKEFRFSSNYTTVALGASRYRITASFDMLTKIKGLFVIPSIQYSMDVISTELDGTRYIKNDGKGGNSFNAEAFASNFIYLNGKSVPYPTLHDLGTDTKQTATLGTGWVDNTGHSYTATNATSSLTDLSSVSSPDNVLINFTVSNYSTGTVAGYSADGTYEVESTTEELEGVAFTGDVLINTVKEITLPTASYFSIFDFTTLALKRFSSTVDYGDGLLSVSTIRSVTDSHQFVFNHTSPLTEADVTAIEAEPNLAFRMLFGEVLPSGFSNTDVGWFSGGNEGLASGAYVQDLATDLGSEEIVNGGFDTDSDWTKGESTTISGGTANINTSTNGVGVSQDLDVIVEGSIYLIVFDIISVTRGEVNFALKGTNFLNTTDLQTGSHLYIVVAGSGATDTYIRGLSTGAEFVMDNYSTKELIAYAEIQDYGSATRTTLANQSNGASNIKLIRDGSGRTTGTAVANTTQWEADGRTAVTNWTIVAPFTITEDIDGDAYDFTSDGNRYKNTVADGTYTLPTGVWTLDEFGFDGVTPVTARGATKKVNEIVVP